MSNQSETREPGAGGSHNPVVNPASIETINRLGRWSLVFVVLILYLLVTTWPVVPEGGKAFQPINLFGFWVSWAPDRQMMFTVMMAGAVGSFTHTLTSFGDYVGNRELSTNWIWFLVLRIPIGIALALLFYFIIRGGLLIPTVQVQPPQTPATATLQLNPYSIAAFSALAGMFSKQATDKLAAVFDAVFAMKKEVGREGALGSGQPLKITPPTLTQGKPQDLTVAGKGFQTGSIATINGAPRDFKATSDAEAIVTIRDADVKDTGDLSLLITNPNKDTFRATIRVVAAGTAATLNVKPVISSTEPAQLTTTSRLLTVNGQGFQAGCVTTINGNERKAASIDDNKITIPLQAGDFVASGELKLVIRNPNGQSAEVTLKAA